MLYGIIFRVLFIFQVQIFSYQCSQLSTPESVIEVFNNASKFQAKQDMASYVAVVVLDEVGLAEDSPNLPLKALHPLLEDGTEGARKDFTDQVCCDTAMYVCVYVVTGGKCADNFSTRTSSIHWYIQLGS